MKSSNNVVSFSGFVNNLEVSASHDKLVFDLRLQILI